MGSIQTRKIVVGTLNNEGGDKHAYLIQATDGCLDNLMVHQLIKQRGQRPQREEV